jgi:hypothetical protein
MPAGDRHGAVPTRALLTSPPPRWTCQAQILLRLMRTLQRDRHRHRCSSPTGRGGREISPRGGGDVRQAHRWARRCRERSAAAPTPVGLLGAIPRVERERLASIEGECHHINAHAMPSPMPFSVRPLSASHMLTWYVRVRPASRAPLDPVSCWAAVPPEPPARRRGDHERQTPSLC